MWRRLRKAWHQCSLFMRTIIQIPAAIQTIIYVFQGLLQIFYERYFSLESFESKCSFSFAKIQTSVTQCLFNLLIRKKNFACLACQCLTKGWPNLVKFHIILQVKIDPLIGYVKFFNNSWIHGCIYEQLPSLDYHLDEAGEGGAPQRPV